MKTKLFSFILILTSGLNAGEWEYFGEKRPKNHPIVFAKGIVSTDLLEHSSPTFSPDLKKIFWQVRENGKHVIKYSLFENGSWTSPRTLELQNEYRVDSPFVSNDGSVLYYSSRSPLPNEKQEGDHNVWVISLSDKVQGPKPFGNPLNSENLEVSVSQSVKGNIYFVKDLEGVEGNMGIYCTILDDGIYQSPKVLSRNINSQWLDWTPWIDSKEEFLLFSSHRPGGFGSGDLYISFRNEDDTFSDPINLGPEVNTDFQERFPSVSPDGKFLFFTRNNPENNHDVYWVAFDSLHHRLKSKYEQGTGEELQPRSASQ